LLYPDRIDSGLAYRVIDLVLPLDPITPKPAPQPPPAPPKVAEPKPLPVPAEQTKLLVPNDLPQLVKIQTYVVAPELPPVPSALPNKIIQVGSFGTSAVPTVNAPAQKVQTGGFGDPLGLPGQGKPGARLTVNALGSFDLPPGPGGGNGTGEAKGIKGTVASAGFGNGNAQLGQGNGRKNGEGVQPAWFTAQQVVANTGKHVADNSPEPTTPVEILYKPSPIYTEEARKLNLEGEVLLEVMFRADGQLTVNRVLRGLGHGLDEAAVNAAGKIKFKAAQRNGTPIDSTAVVHVLFRFAS
jgi:TonB family protein